MDLSQFKEELTVRFIDFDKESGLIHNMRRTVFMQEQGFSEFLVHNELDSDSLHIGAFHNGTLVSLLSAHMFREGEKSVLAMGLPPIKRFAFQFTKRAELPEYRGYRLSELLIAVLYTSIYETIPIDYVFIVLLGVHKKLSVYYTQSYGFEYLGESETPAGVEAVFLLNGPDCLKTQYLKTRKMLSVLLTRFSIAVPSLYQFLMECNKTDLIDMESMKQKNLYTAPLSIKDELPRLTAQARLLFMDQIHKLEQTEFPSGPAKLLDAGCGTGLYLSMLSQHQKFGGYQFFGIDQSPEFVMYAKLSFPKTYQWKQASVYDTGFEDNSFDVVHSSFVFIHLQNPELALAEIRRILKPGGVFYVVDPNDSTFDGPPQISYMIKKHSDIYEGNRRISNVLPEMAERAKLRLRNRYTTLVDNTGREGEPIRESDSIHLGKISMWGMFYFIGQREDMANLFQEAENYYFLNGSRISIEIQTQVYVNDK